MLSVINDLAFSFEKCLCAANMMLPALAKMNAINHPVDGVIADIWVDLLNEGMKFSGAKPTLPEKKQDRITEDRLGCFSPCALFEKLDFERVDAFLQNSPCSDSH